MKNFADQLKQINNIIEPSGLLEWINQQTEFQFVNLTNENLENHFIKTSTWIPVHNLFSRISELKTDIPVVLCCRVGADSFFCMNILVNEYHMRNVYSLKSGITGLDQFIKNQPNS